MDFRTKNLKSCRFFVIFRDFSLRESCVESQRCNEKASTDGMINGSVSTDLSRAVFVERERDRERERERERERLRSSLDEVICSPFIGPRYYAATE